MAYEHGAYATESATQVQPAPAVDSALPFVVGYAPVWLGELADSDWFKVPRVISNWSEYVKAFGGQGDISNGFDEYSLSSFAEYWFRQAGRGDCVFCAVPVTTQKAYEDAGDNIGLTLALSDGKLKATITKTQLQTLVNDLESNKVLRVYVSSSAIVSWENGELADVITRNDDGSMSVEFPTGGNVSAGAVFLNIEYTAFAGDGVANDIKDTIDCLETVYARFGRAPALLCVPYYNCFSTVYNHMVSAVDNYAGQFEAFCACDIPSHPVSLDGSVCSVVTDSQNVNAAKLGTDKLSLLCWPHCGVGNSRYDGSTVCIATMNRTDGENNNSPFVSPSNKRSSIDGVYVQTASNVESAVFMTREQVNNQLNGNGIVGFLNTSAGWVVWGNRTAAYPGSTDIKDNLISIRRVFGYVKNIWQLFAQPRIDLPLNKRQLDGVINSFNQKLQGLRGLGVVNAASVALSDLNTTESLLDGVVYISVYIAPPPPMRVLKAVLEYDVASFAASIA